MMVMGELPRFSRRCTNWTVAAVVCCLLFLGTTIARAANTSHRAARLSYVQGIVTVAHEDNTANDPAQMNMPLPEGVRLTTANDGQAEIEFEDGSLMRLTPNSSLSLTSLTADGDGNFQTKLTLMYGLAYAELRAADKFTYNVDAGGEVISPVVNATVRIAMDQPPAAISVLDGTVQVVHANADGGGSYRVNVNSGETLTGNASDPGRYSITQEIAENSWDKWNDDRDQAAADQAADQTDVRNNYAGEAGYGWSDLDANGNWYNVPGEGEVWQPDEAAAPNFDPYGYGSWVWYPGRGYVWASGYNWGWTPYHCGNWSYWNGFGWGWIPGNGCGYGRGGFWSGGYVVNIVRFPRGYRLRPVPVHNPGGGHPIRIGHPSIRPVGHRPVREPRTIAGHTLEPLRPTVRPGDIRGGRDRGGALRRDFPVDRANHRPVLGRSAAAGTAAPTGSTRPEGERPVNPRSGEEGREGARRSMRPEAPATQRQFPSRQEQPRPAPPESGPRYSRPIEPHNNVQRPQQREMSRPQPQQQIQPRYSQPAQPRSASPPPRPAAPPPPRPAAPQSSPSPRSSTPAPQRNSR